MLELSARGGEQPPSALQLGYGGDTLNTAVYLARLGVAAEYVTLLGDDRHSHWMMQCWQAEQVGTGLVGCLGGRVPGLYMIDTDSSGERSFSYWRGESPARELFDDPGRVAKLERSLADYSLIYFSGISLSLYGEAGRERLFDMLARLRAGGARIAYDGNYRPAGWPDADRAREEFTRACSGADILLPTFDDEQALFGDADPDATLARLRSCGAREMVIKLGASGCLVASDDQVLEVPSCKVAQPVDTTAAGDSFNAGYLAGRLLGEPAGQAARWGHRLAAEVIQHRGAILDAQQMPDLAGADSGEEHG